MSRFEVPLVMLRSRYLKLIHWRSAAILVGTPFVMIMSMCAMLPMHEDMEYRTSQNEKPRQPAQSVSTMLRDEVKGGDCEKAIEGDAARCKLGSLSVTALCLSEFWSILLLQYRAWPRQVHVCRDTACKPTARQLLLR